MHNNPTIIENSVARKPRSKSFRKSYSIEVNLTHASIIDVKWKLKPSFKPQNYLLAKSEMLLDSI